MEKELNVNLKRKELKEKKTNQKSIKQTPLYILQNQLGENKE